MENTNSQSIRHRVYARRIFYVIDGDRRLNIQEENIHVMIFLSVIDTEILQLNNRFIGLYEVGNQ